MRMLTFFCLIAASCATGEVWSGGHELAQPESIAPSVIRQSEYVYDPGEDLDEKYIYKTDENGELSRSVAAKGDQPPASPPTIKPLPPVEATPAPVSIPSASEAVRPSTPAARTSAPDVSAEIETPGVSDRDSADFASGSIDCGSCNACNCRDCRASWCDCAGDFSLDGALGWECCPYNIGGWTNPGYTTNNVPLSQSYDDLLSFSDVPDNVNLYQQWLYIERVVDGSNGWDLGGRVDAIYGTDAQKTQAFGNPGAGVRGQGFYDASWDHGIYGFAMPQLYGEVAYYDLAVKVGHFFTPMGYEVIPATGNFFFTHSYTMFNSEPFTHTGALATYSGSEALTLYGGWTLGWDTGFDQLDGGNNFLGGFSSQLSDAVSFTYIATIGNFGWRDDGAGDSYNHSIVVIADVTDDLQYVFQSDNLHTGNAGADAFDTIGAVNYLFYTVSEKSKLGGRIEWWKADGVSYNELTLGWNYNLLTNLVFRPEWRQDWAPGADVNEDTFAIDAVWSY